MRTRYARTVGTGKSESFAAGWSSGGILHVGSGGVGEERELLSAKAFLHKYRNVTGIKSMPQLTSILTVPSCYLKCPQKN